MVSFISDGKGTAFFIIRKTKCRKKAQKISIFARAIVDFRRYRLFFDLFWGHFFACFCLIFCLFLPVSLLSFLLAICLSLFYCPCPSKCRFFRLKNAIFALKNAHFTPKNSRFYPIFRFFLPKFSGGFSPFFC